MEDLYERGWKGNSSDTSVEEVTEDISIIKSAKDCPQLEALFRNMNKKFINISSTVTNLAYPNGRCCKAVLPKKASETSVLKMHFKVLIKNNLPKVQAFEMFLSSQETSSVLKLHNFNTNIPLKANKKQKGYTLYNVKLLKEFILEEDPKVKCKNYDEKNGYAKVFIFVKYVSFLG